MELPKLEFGIITFFYFKWQGKSAREKQFKGECPQNDVFRLVYPQGSKKLGKYGISERNG